LLHAMIIETSGGKRYNYPFRLTTAAYSLYFL